MTLPAILALAYLTVFLVNLAPAAMPPTWAILAYFLLRYDVPILPLVIGGAFAASAGRTALALASRRWGRRLLSPRQRDNMSALGRWLETRGRWGAPVAVLVYSFGPIPSNQLFMAAGLTGTRLAPIVGAFFAGRLVSYIGWTLTAAAVADRFEGLFTTRWGNISALAADGFALTALVLFTRLDWRRLLHLPSSALSAEPGSQAAPAEGRRRY